MNQNISFGRKLLKYLLLLLSHFTFVIAALLAFSYFQDILRAFVWQKNFNLMIAALTISTLLWIITAIGYLFID